MNVTINERTIHPRTSMRPDGDIIEVSTNQRPNISTGHRPMIDSKIDVPRSSQLPLSIVIKTT
jgi:hypothetical protein